MSERVRAFDWSKTPLGPLESWPQSLKTAVGIMLRSAVPMVMLCGADGVMIYNDAYSVFAGGRHPSILGSKVREGWAEVADFNDNVMKVGLAGGALAYRDQELILFRNGGPEQVWMNLDYSPILDDAGRPAGVLAIVVETTERVRAERALRESAEQLRLATEAAEVGFWDVDNVTDTLVWPPRVKAMFGISPDTPVSMADFYAGLHPDDYAATVAAYAAANDPERRALYDVEYRTIGKEDGVVRWIAAKGRGIFDEHGACVRVAGVAIDVTRRKADEARLRELNEILERRIEEALAERKLLADVVEGTDAFIQVIDADYRWLAVNRAAADEFERIFGGRPRVGRSLLELLAHEPEQRDDMRARWARALDGEAFTEVSEYVSQGGARHAYEAKFNPLHDRDGRRIGAYLFAYDVTERRREQSRLLEAEAALRQTQKLDAMGQLTGGVAHDFNNLLTPIIGSLDMLQRRRVGGVREQRLIEGALQSAERAKTLVQRLLAFARRQPLQPAAVDVGAVVEGMVDLIASTTGPQVALAIEIADDLPPAKADANQLEMALLNLAVNARDAMGAGGALRIRAAADEVGADRPTHLPPGRYVRLLVADTGVGMDEAVLARAIEPFFSTKGVGKGTGLGLSMVHGLASQLGGALTISSRPGEGTDVELWLPVSAERPAGEHHRALDAPRAQTAGVVLLVDDEEAVRASTADMLADLGYAVVEAASSADALALLDGGLRIDLLVTDHLMPGLSGVELARMAAQRRPHVRALVVSGFAEVEGVDPDLPRLTKPFRQAELAAMLASLDADGDKDGAERSA